VGGKILRLVIFSTKGVREREGGELKYHIFMLKYISFILYFFLFFREFFIFNFTNVCFDKVLKQLKRGYMNKLNIKRNSSKKRYIKVKEDFRMSFFIISLIFLNNFFYKNAILLMLFRIENFFIKKKN